MRTYRASLRSRVTSITLHATLAGLLVTSQDSQAASVTAAPVKLVWNANSESGITGYKLSYGTTSGVYPNVVQVGTDPTASVSGLIEGNTYYFTVAAVGKSGKQSAPSAEISYHVEPSDLIPSSGWELQFTDSEESQSYPAAAAFDGNISSFWHTDWKNSLTSALPHEIQIDLGTAQGIGGFRYLPRQDSNLIGNIANYEFYVSLDGISWGKPVATGTFAKNSSEKEVLFTAVEGRYIRLVALSEVNGGSDTNVAEIKLIRVTPSSRPVNQAPTANATSVSTLEDTPVSFTLAGTDPDGDPLAYTIVQGPSKGVLSGTAPNLTYTPTGDSNGADSFSFRVNDGTADSEPALVSIHVTAVNDPPVAVSKSVATTKNTAVAVALTASDKDSPTLTFSVVNSPANGTLSGTPPNLSYTPSANFTGNDSFTFRANDGFSNSATATVSISVSATNATPVATAGAWLTQEDTPVAITLAANDADDDILTYTVVSSPSKGTLSGTPPNLTYTPAADVNGSDSFTFRVHDGTVHSEPATVSITIVPVNDPPVAVSKSVTTPKNTPVAVALAGSDRDSPSVTFSIVGSPANGTLSGTPPHLTYTPATNFTGSDSFTYRANDGSADSAPATISISVTPSNAAPVASAKSWSTSEDTPVAITLTATDADGDTLAYTIVSSPSKGVLSGTPPNLTYTPAADVNGSDSFTFRVNDGTVNSEPATVSITITAVNDPPVAVSKSVATTKNTPVAVVLSGTDKDSSSLTYSVLAPPANGVLSGTPPNLTYTPSSNFSGSDSFTYRANDGTAFSTAATVSISIAATNAAPVAVAKSVTTPEDTPVAITLSGTDTDGDPLSYSIATSPSKGTLSGIAPNLTYSPSANFHGTDSFTYRVNDGILNSAVATVSITVTPVNDAPVATPAAVTVAEDSRISIVLAGTDVDGNPLSYSVVTGPSRGTLTGTPPNLTYIPAANYFGADSFTFQVNDGTVNSAPATVSITVTPVNDAPVAISKTLSTVQDTALPVVLSATDIEGSPLTYSIVSPPVNGTLHGTGANLTYQPVAGFVGSDSFTYRAHDGTTHSAAATISISITKKPPFPGTTLLPQTGWTLKYVDSQESFDAPATQAFDGNPATFWHTQWRNGSNAPPPHEIQINLGAVRSIGGFQYLPRQDPYIVGMVGDYEFYVSSDGLNWGNPVATGTFANDKSEKQVLFSTVSGQFIRFKALSEANGFSDCCVAELNILQGTVTNRPPVATSRTLSTEANSSLPILLTGSDPDGNAISFSITGSPSHGTLSGTPPAVTYLPDAGYSGPDSFSFQTNDGAVYSMEATISIQVTPVTEVPGNVAPAFTSNPINTSATEDSPFSGQLSATDANAGDILSFSKISGPSWLVVAPDGKLSGTPLNSHVGNNAFTVRVADPSNASALAILNIRVTNTNDAPVFKITPLIYPAGTEKILYRDQTLASTAADPDSGDTLVYSKTSGPEWLTVSKNGALGGTPPAGTAGLNQFVVRVTDASGESSTAPLQIRINSNTLPLPWNLDRVGSGNIAGAARYSAGMFTVAGAGALSTKQDAGNFGWQTLTGDGQIVARVAKLDDTGKSTRVGVMIRESLAANSRHAFLGLNGEGNFHWLRRANTGGKTVKTVSKNQGSDKVWLKLVREGDTITAYESDKGAKWTKLGKAKINLPRNCYIGLSVSSGKKDKLNTSKFGNVRVSR